MGAERRVAEDGVAYTQEEFTAHYGGLAEWLSAAAVLGDADAATVVRVAPDAVQSPAAGDWQAVAAEGGTYWYHSATHECVWFALFCPRSVVCGPLYVRVPFIDAASPLSSALTPRSSPTAILHAAHERRTTWDDPSLIANAASSVADAASAPQDAAQDDAHGWVEHTDPESGGVYLVHSETHETRWP